MNTENLAAILELHRKWTREESGGARANLQEADLWEADLQGANLQGANLWGADLRAANLWGADLQGVNLWGANLWGASLRGANLQGANLQRANLRAANLWGANLRGADFREANLQVANLQGADLQGARLSSFSIVPEGDIVVWKAVKGAVVKLQVKAAWKRVSIPTSRKCRAEKAKVLNIYSLDGKELKGSIQGIYGSAIKYRKGKIVTADNFNDDIRVECTGGIHFFLTREEAKEWSRNY